MSSHLILQGTPEQIQRFEEEVISRYLRRDQKKRDLFTRREVVHHEWAGFWIGFAIGMVFCALSFMR